MAVGYSAIIFDEDASHVVFACKRTVGDSEVADRATRSQSTERSGIAPCGGVTDAADGVVIAIEVYRGSANSPRECAEDFELFAAKVEVFVKTEIYKAVGLVKIHLCFSGSIPVVHAADNIRVGFCTATSDFRPRRNRHEQRKD